MKGRCRGRKVKSGNQAHHGKIKLLLNGYTYGIQVKIYRHDRRKNAGAFKIIGCEGIERRPASGGCNRAQPRFHGRSPHPYVGRPVKRLPLEKGEAADEQAEKKREKQRKNKRGFYHRAARD